MILILTNSSDVTTDLVTQRLAEMEADYLRLDADDWPNTRVATKLPNPAVSICSGDHTVDLGTEPLSVWNRRTILDDKEASKAWQLDPGSPELGFAKREWLGWLRSLRTLPGVSWTNDPVANWRAGAKLEQLSLAQRIGFKVPETRVSNDPDELIRFADANGGSVVVKAVTSGMVESDDQSEFVFSQIATVEELQEGRDAIATAPICVQEAITPKTDYRVTIVGETVFTHEISMTDEGGIDWRPRQDEANIEEVELPMEVEKRCHALLDEMGLQFAAIDLAERDDFYFLEINPNGEWGWLEASTGSEISRAMAVHLHEGGKKA